MRLIFPCGKVQRCSLHRRNDDPVQAACAVPGQTNIWAPPIRNRIDMLATGIKSLVGIKVAGASLQKIDRITAGIEHVVKQVLGVSSAFAERPNEGAEVQWNVNTVKPGSRDYSSFAGLRNGRNSPLATESGTENEYRPSMLMCSCSSGDSLAMSSSLTSKPSARSWFNAASM